MMDMNCGQYMSNPTCGPTSPPPPDSGCAKPPSLLDTLRCELRRKARQKTEQAVYLQQDADVLNKLADTLD